jgi:hypothetical protein
LSLEAMTNVPDWARVKTALLQEVVGPPDVRLERQQGRAVSDAHDRLVAEMEDATHLVHAAGALDGGEVLQGTVEPPVVSS